MPATKRKHGKGVQRFSPYKTVRPASVEEWETTSQVLAREAAAATARELAKSTAISSKAKEELAIGWHKLDLTKQHVEWSAPVVSSPFLTFNIPRTLPKPTALDAWIAVVGPEFYDRLIQHHQQHGTTFHFLDRTCIAVDAPRALLYHGLRFEMMSVSEEHRTTDTMAATESCLRDDWKKVLSVYQSSYPEPKVMMGVNAVEMIHARLVVLLRWRTTSI